MAIPVARKYDQWVLRPVHNPWHPPRTFLDAASPELILEEMRQESELANVGRRLFSGSLPAKNRLWREFRNFTRQAESNYVTGLGAPDRSACLLFYYSMLNWVKAELLIDRPHDILDKKVFHGLSFDPTAARSVKGDFITVHGEGVFPWIYRRRTGNTIPSGTQIPVKLLLRQIPEIGTQVHNAGLGITRAVGVFQLIAHDRREAWSLLAVQRGAAVKVTSTWNAIRAHFQRVTPPQNWRDHFSISRRAAVGELIFMQLKDPIALNNAGSPKPADVEVALTAAISRTFDALKAWIDLHPSSSFDGLLCPSLYNTRSLCVPASLARYMIMFYASSLVRYRPSMFDSQLHPEQALLFDAVARECAVPILQDTVSGLRGRPHYFRPITTIRS